MRRWLLLVILVFMATFAIGRNGGYYSFNDLYDFEVRTVYNTLQDSTGAIWFGTPRGLFRFDGSRIKRYIDPHYASGYTNLRLDPAGHIWFQNFTGQLFYWAKDSIHLFWSANGRGDSWFEYNLKHYPSVYIINTDKFYKYPFAQPQSETLLLENPEGRYFQHIDVLADTIFLLSSRYHAQNETKFSMYSLLKNKSTLTVRDSFVVQSPIPHVSGFPSTGGQVFTVLSTDSVSLFSLAEQKILWHTPLLNATERPLQWVETLSEGKGYLIGRRKGLSIFSRGGLTELNHFKNDNISQSFHDRQGNHWITTLNNGVFIKPSSVFKKLFQTNTSFTGATDADNGMIYLGAQNGALYSFNTRNVQPELVHTFDKQIGDIFFNPNDKSLYASNFQKPLCPQTKKSTFNFSGFKDLLFVKPHEVILCKSSTLLQLSTKASFSVAYKSMEEKADWVFTGKSYERRLRNRRSGPVAIDFVTKDLLAQFNDGLFVFSEKAPKAVTYKKEVLQASALRSHPQKGVLIYTRQKQLFLYRDKKLSLVDSFRLNYNNIICYKNYLFMRSLSSIVRLDTLTHEKIYIDKTDGLPDEDIVDMILLGDSMYVVTRHELIAFSCSYDFKDKVGTVPQIIKLSIHDEQRPITDRLDLKYDENYLDIEFASADIRSQDVKLYRYRLNGLDNKWTEVAFDKNTVRYAQLPPGEFSFEVQAMNADRIYSTSKKIEIVIHQVFYKKGWFIALLVFLIGLLAFITTRYWYKNRERKSRLEQENDQLEKEIFKSKIAAIRSQMNPHFMFNALNTIQEFIMTNQKEIASEYLADFADLMRMYLNQSKADTIPLEEEVATLQLYLRLEKLRFEENFDFTIEVSEELEQSEAKIPVMLLQPFVENAIKHGLLHKRGAKRLKLVFERAAQFLKITISDNGIGRKKSEEINKSRRGHDSFATSAIKERIAIYNATGNHKIEFQIRDVLNKDKESAGTEVILHILMN